jgi:hypothetical protein
MMRDEAVAAADVEHVGLRRQHACDFKGHVISASNLAAPSHAREATLDRCSQTRHCRRSVQARCLDLKRRNHLKNKASCATGANLCRHELPTTELKVISAAERQASAYEDAANGGI